MSVRKKETFNINLSRRGVCAIEVGSEAGVTPGIFLECLCDDERVQLAVGEDLNIRAVLQLLALAKPPAIVNHFREIKKLLATD